MHEQSTRDHGQLATGARRNRRGLPTEGSGRCPDAAPLATMRSLAGPARTRALSGRRSVLAAGRRRWDPGRAAGAGGRKASAEAASKTTSAVRAVSSRGEHEDGIGHTRSTQARQAPSTKWGMGLAFVASFLFLMVSQTAVWQAKSRFARDFANELSDEIFVSRDLNSCEMTSCLCAYHLNGGASWGLVL